MRDWFETCLRRSAERLPGAGFRKLTRDHLSALSVEEVPEAAEVQGPPHCAAGLQLLYNRHYIDKGCTMHTLKITTVGASSGVILTKEVMAHLKVKKGDTLYLTEAADGGYRLTPYNPEFARQMALADEIMHDDREVLRALAK